MLFLFAALIACIVMVAFTAMKSSDVYKTALARAKADPRVQQALGSDIHDGMFTSGKTNVTGPSGDADLSIPISGPKGKATIYVVATKSAGEWQYSKLIVKTDNGEEIDLTGKSGESEKTDEDDKN